MLKKIIRCSENMKIGDKKFDLKNKTYIMGIIDVTRDSFYKQSRYPFLERNTSHGRFCESSCSGIPSSLLLSIHILMPYHLCRHQIQLFRWCYVHR